MEATSSNTSSRMTYLSTVIKQAKWKELEEAENGYIFTDKHLASNWNDIYVQPEALSKGEAQKGMRKVTSPVLLLKSHSPKMAFILATEASPVYVCSSYKHTKTDGYSLLFSLMPDVYPEYFFYLAKYNSWDVISKSIDIAAKYELGKSYQDIGLICADGINDIYIYAEDVFLSGIHNIRKFPIPSLQIQNQQINNAKMMERVIFEKMSEKERKFQQKEWLNESHIRNCKHRLSNDIMPIRMAVERLKKCIANSTDGIKLSYIVGQATQQTVEQLLRGLTNSICKIEEDIKVLTEIESSDKQIETLDVNQFVREFCDKFGPRYKCRFSVCIKAVDENLKIKISRHAFTEMFDNIFSNAVRHGFTDKERDDYKIVVTISETCNGYCKIDIANNGNPISERGKKEYFVKGSFAGETGHTGLGGARVFDICEEADGKVMEPYSTKEFPFVISVEFPIIYNK